MQKFRITDRLTGVHIATYVASGPLDALDRLARSSGFVNHRESEAADRTMTKRLIVAAEDGAVYLPEHLVGSG
jgi:hypothetical protein